MDVRSSLVVWGTSLSLTLALYGLYRSLTSGKAAKLPPGPPADLLIGHLRQIPFEYQEKTFQEWGKIYGDVVCVHFLGTPLVILGSQQAARDLLEKRSAIYSDRPRFALSRELMGWENTINTIPYGDQFRKHRKLLQEYLNAQNLRQYRGLQELEAVTLVQEVLKAPDAFTRHFKRFAAGVIMKIAYGHTVTSVDDEYVRLADIAGSRTIELGGSSAILVDFFPVLKYLPAWFPGGGFKRKALSIRKDVRSMLNVPYDMVKRTMKTENMYPSLTSTYIEAYEKDGKMSASDEEDIKGVAGILYVAAQETTATVLETFILAMVLYPDVYKRAQAELDRVLGRDRLPELSDRDSLPYLNSVVIETYRWHSPVPLGVPHRVMEDDVYRDYRIPKGATILANIWAMTQDPSVYPDPHLFLPERFIGEAAPPDPRELVFGFGRRICPGRAFADTNIWLAIASMTATLHISKALDANGMEVTPPFAFSCGVTGHPKPFKCTIQARFEETPDVVHRTAAGRQS